jgi:hypothetical protein
MRFRASSAFIFLLLAGSVFAQSPGQWHDSKDGISLKAKDYKHSISVKNQGGVLSFIVTSPQYLRTQPEKIKATVRFDTARPQSFEMVNVKKSLAVLTDQKARSLIEQLASAKKLHVRLYSHDERYCDDLVFDNTYLDLPANTSEVIGKLLGASTSGQ